MAEKMATRQAYGKFLKELAATNQNAVVMDADLSGSTMTKEFKAVAPERFFHSLLRLIISRRLTMPASIVCHEGYAVTLVGLGQDHCGTTLASSCAVEGFDDFFQIMTIDFDHVPTEGLELFVDGLHIHNIFVLTVDLETIPVNDGAQVVQLVVRSSHGRFPNQTFLDFTVT